MGAATSPLFDRRSVRVDGKAIKGAIHDAGRRDGLTRDLAITGASNHDRVARDARGSGVEERRRVQGPIKNPDRRRDLRYGRNDRRWSSRGQAAGWHRAARFEWAS